MDADIYGPSVPKMMGKTRPTDDHRRKLDPVENFGLKMMSMALVARLERAGHLARPEIMKSDSAVHGCGETGASWMSSSSICRPARATPSFRWCRPWPWTAP